MNQRPNEMLRHRHWDACAPIAPQGTWLLEASAGTGKTWQLASLVARLVVEQEPPVPIEKILIITFTNAATAELRDRVRGRLAEVRDTLIAQIADKTGLAAASEQAGATLQARDPVLHHICFGPAEGPTLSGKERAARLLNAKVALSNFDLAPISTIHGFCQRMLDTLAFESGQDAGLELLDDVTPLRKQLVADAIADLQAKATPEAMAIYRTDWQWTTETLLDVSDKASSVSGRWIEPDVHLHAVADAGARTIARAGELRSVLQGDAWARFTRALQDDSTNRPAEYDSRFSKGLANRLEIIAGWARQPGSLDGVLKALRELQFAGQRGLKKKWAATAPLSFPEPIREQITGLITEIEALKAAANPLARFADTARATIAAELQTRRVLTFDSMLTNLAAAIERERDAGGARPLRDAIAGQFEVALIDEFQDTDIAQWTVLREVFHEASGRRLFLIGDPKQAIYRFRGADVYVYLGAKKLTIQSETGRADGQFTMARNYRTDGPLVASLNRLWGEDTRAFGDLQMDYEQVDWPARQAAWCLVDAPGVRRRNKQQSPRRPLEIRWLDGGEDEAGERRFVSKKDEGLFLAADACAREIGELLSSDAGIIPRPDAAIAVDQQAPTDGPAAVDVTAKRALRPGDFAVLVHEHKHGRLVKRALAKRGIMAVAGGKNTVFESPVAAWLLQLLDALAQPTYEAYGKALAVSPLVGYSLQELHAALEEADGAALASTPSLHSDGNPIDDSPIDDSPIDDSPIDDSPIDDSPIDDSRADGDPADEDTTSTRPPLRWDAWRKAVETWSSRWSKHRFAGVVQRISRDYRLTEQLLTLEDGERLATDFRHLFEVCHVAEQANHFGPAGLADWLRQERGRGGAAGRDAHGPRLESDANAVQIVTTYSAKGLQYPIVMLPFAWALNRGPLRYTPLVIHPQRTDDVTPEGGGSGGLGRAQDDNHAVLSLHPNKSAEHGHAKDQNKLENREELLRKLYVEMTRAEHHCVVWAGAVTKVFHETAVNALLLRPAGHEGLAYDAVKRRWGDLASWPTARTKDPAAADAKRFAANAKVADYLDALAGDQHDASAGAFGWSYCDPVDGRPSRYMPPATTAAALATTPYAGRDRLQSAWQRASFSSMAPSLGKVDERSAHAVHRPQADDERLRGGMDEPDESNEAAADAADVQRAPEQPKPTAADGLPLPLAAMWGGTKVGTWAHAILEHLDFQPRDEDGDVVAVDEAHLQFPSATDDGAAQAAAIAAAAAACPYVRRAVPGETRRQSAMALAAELGAQHGHQRAADHALFIAALPQMLRAPLSVPGRGAGFSLPAGYCLEHLQPADRIDELAFDLSLVGGDAWRPEPDGSSGARIDGEAVKLAFSLRRTGRLDANQSSSGGAAQGDSRRRDKVAGEAQPKDAFGWDGAPWIESLLGRVADSEAELRAWEKLDPKSRPKPPKVSAILPRIAGMLTGLIDLTFRARCEDGQVRYFIADYKTNKITSVGDRQVRREHYTRPWLAWSMAHSNYHLQSLIYTLALHRFLAERLPGYDPTKRASYDTHVGGHFYLYLRGMAAPFAPVADADPVHVHGVYADRWPWVVIDAFDRALDPALHAWRFATADDLEVTP